MMKGIFANMAIKFVSVRTSPHVTRLMGSREQTVSAEVTGSGDSIKIGNRYRCWEYRCRIFWRSKTAVFI